MKREINCIGESLDPPLDFSWGHVSQYSFTLFCFIKMFKSHCRSFRRVNKREKGELHYAVQRGTIEQKEQVSLDSQNPTMQSYLQYSYFPHRLYLTFLLIKLNHQPVCLCSNFLGTILEIARTRHRFCMHCMPFIFRKT